jgi:hypothetical protein
MRNSYRILVGKPEGKKSGRIILKWILLIWLREGLL